MAGASKLTTSSSSLSPFPWLLSGPSHPNLLHGSWLQLSDGAPCQASCSSPLPTPHHPLPARLYRAARPLCNSKLPREHPDLDLSCRAFLIKSQFNYSAWLVAIHPHVPEAQSKEAFAQAAPCGCAHSFSHSFSQPRLGTCLVQASHGTLRRWTGIRHRPCP